MNFITEIREGFGISWAAIRANKLRSILTTLGIVIGIVTVTLMGTAIEGLNQSFMSSISSLGADVFFVSRDAWFNNNEGEWRKTQRRRPLKIAEANKLIGQLELSSAVAPVAQSGARVESRSNPWNYGAICDHLRHRHLRGTFLFRRRSGWRPPGLHHRDASFIQSIWRWLGVRPADQD